MNYNNYLNKESGKQDIYTKNSLLKMTLQDIIDKEMELSYQYNTIGIPADEDMYASPYVRQYTAESGLPMWTSATDVINNLQSLRQFASQPNFFPKGLKSTKEMIEEERQKRLLRQQQNSEMDLDTTQADDMMKPLEVNPNANALNMESEEQINPFENWSTKSQPIQQTSNTNSLVGNIGNLANKLSQKFGNPMEEKLGLKVFEEEEDIDPNKRIGIAQEMNVPIEGRGIVPQNMTVKKGGIAPLQEHKYTLRTDPMWDDMKREMLDPNIAAQKKLQEARELESFNQAWDRIHGVNDKAALQKEPFLSYENLLNPQGLQKRLQEQYMEEDYQQLMQNSREDLTPQDILLKMDMFSPKRMNGTNSLVDNYEQGKWLPASKKLEAAVSKYEGLPETYNEIRFDDTLTKEQKADLIKKVSENNLRQIELEDKEARKKILKNFGKDVAKATPVAIATTYFPWSRAGGALAKTVAPKLASKVGPAIKATNNKLVGKLLPYAGKKISEDVLTGVADGVLPSVVEQSIDVINNPHDTRAQSIAGKLIKDSALGGFTGSLRGIASKTSIKNAINKVGELNALNPRQQKKILDATVNYHNDYQAGTNIKLPDGTKTKVGMLDYGDIKLNEAKIVTDLKTQVARGNLQKGDSLYDKTLGKQQKTPKLNSHEQWLEELKRRRRNISLGFLR